MCWIILVPTLLCDCCLMPFPLQNTWNLLCWSSISSHFCLIAFSAAQVWWLCVHARQCTIQRTSSQDNSLWLQNGVPDFAVEKTVTALCSSHKTGWGSIQHIFSWTLVKPTNNCVFFCILTCNITLLSISVKVRNIIVNFCVRIKEYLITENMYLVWFTSA